MSLYDDQRRARWARNLRERTRLAAASAGAGTQEAAVSTSPAATAPVAAGRLATVQPRLDLRNADGTRLHFRKPLLGLDACKGAMGLGEDEVLAEISARRLRWAFDLRCNGERMFLRVWTRAVAAWSNPALELPTSFDVVLESLLPPQSRVLGVITTDQLDQLGFGTAGHLHNLIEQGLLKSIGLAGQRDSLHGRRGPGGSPNVTRASVVALLKERLL